MRSHQQIVKDYRAASLARDLQSKGVVVHQTTPQRWADRDSIPGEYWAHLVDLGAATLEELASASAAPTGAPQTGAAA